MWGSEDKYTELEYLGEVLRGLRQLNRRLMKLNKRLDAWDRGSGGRMSSCLSLSPSTQCDWRVSLMRTLSQVRWRV